MLDEDRARPDRLAAQTDDGVGQNGPHVGVCGRRAELLEPADAARSPGTAERPHDEGQGGRQRDDQAPAAVEPLRRPGRRGDLLDDPSQVSGELGTRGQRRQQPAIPEDLDRHRGGREARLERRHCEPFIGGGDERQRAPRTERERANRVDDREPNGAPLVGRERAQGLPRSSGDLVIGEERGPAIGSGDRQEHARRLGIGVVGGEPGEQPLRAGAARADLGAERRRQAQVRSRIGAAAVPAQEILQAVDLPSQRQRERLPERLAAQALVPRPHPTDAGAAPPAGVVPFFPMPITAGAPTAWP